MKKKLLSLLLALAMCLSLSVPAFALEQSSLEQIYDEYTFIPFPSEEGTTVFLACKDYANGDAEFLHIENDVIVESAYLNRSLSTLEVRSSNPALPQRTQTISLPTVTSASLPAVQSSISVGSITYAYYTQGYPSTRTVSLRYESNSYSQSRYNLNGRYQSIVGFTGAIVTVHSCPSAIAGKIAAWVLFALGITTSTASLIIPDYYVRAQEYESIWTTTCGSATGKLSGSKFIITHETKNEKQVEYEGNYWTVDAYNNRNSSFATDIYQCTPVYWGGDGIVEVTSWG